MTSAFPHWTRRRFLRAASVCVGLPWFESWNRRTWGNPVSPPAPRRLALLYIPNGVNVEKWNVTGSGTDYVLSPTLAPIAPFRDACTVITGLNHENATPGPDGGGDHSRATAVYLTGVRPRKTGGSDIWNGISLDQLAARQIGHLTRLPSLELSTDGPRLSGRCDSGYSCAYQFNLSWASPTKPVPAEQNPRAIFERLFGAPRAGDGSADERIQLRRSVLDYVRDDVHAVSRGLGQGDRAKLEEYLTAVREVEQRLERSGGTTQPAPELLLPPGIPDDYQLHIRIMLELIVLAFQADATRMITFTLANDGSNRAFPEIGIPEAHHQLSHHRNDAETLEKIARIDRFYVEQFAWFLGRLQQVREAEGNLLDHAMVLYGGGISEGNQHLHSNLPLVLAGRGGGTLNPGKRLAVPDPTPMCNLHVALAQRLGVRLQQFGDSTGILEDL
jgi:hypothetical protein